MKRFLWFVLFLPFAASCGIGLPASIGGKGSPGLYVSMKNLFETSGQKNLLGELFDIDTITKQIENSKDGTGTALPVEGTPALWNYVYNQIKVSDTATVNGVPGDSGAVQTYLLYYPVISIDVSGQLPQGNTTPLDVPVPVIDFYAPSFNTMLATLKGIQFKYVYCYIIVDGICNTTSSPANITIGTAQNSTEYLPSNDLFAPDFVTDGSKDFTKAINTNNAKTSTASGFSVTGLFNEPEPSPLRITITGAKVSTAQKIAIKLLFVLPLTFEVPPGNDEITIQNEKWVKLELEQLSSLASDDMFAMSEKESSADFQVKVTNAEFKIYEIKNNILSGINLAFSTKDSGWLSDIIDLNPAVINSDGENGGSVKINGIKNIPQMALVTKADAAGNGRISIPPAERDAEGKLKSEFDFSIAIKIQTEFEGAFDL
ncbi:MAG: hypothetical protein LBG72_09755 [Spirochaetaceae bacterium]|jgi:hypothetical protein|nr:hypothetical protein [Spirochaetaceae bacterium]